MTHSTKTIVLLFVSCIILFIIGCNEGENMFNDVDGDLDTDSTSETDTSELESAELDNEDSETIENTEYNIEGFKQTECDIAERFSEDILLDYSHWTQGQFTSDTNLRLVILQDKSYKLLKGSIKGWGYESEELDSVRYKGTLSQTRFDDILAEIETVLPAPDSICGHFGPDYLDCYDGDGGEIYLHYNDKIFHLTNRCYNESSIFKPGLFLKQQIEALMQDINISCKADHQATDNTAFEYKYSDENLATTTLTVNKDKSYTLLVDYIETNGNTDKNCNGTFSDDDYKDITDKLIQNMYIGATCYESYEDCNNKTGGYIYIADNNLTSQLSVTSYSEFNCLWSDDYFTNVATYTAWQFQNSDGLDLAVTFLDDLTDSILENCTN